MKSNKFKLISSIVAFCLILTLGVFGILAVKQFNHNVGGKIRFNATGVNVTVSQGVPTGIQNNSLTDTMQEFSVSTSFCTRFRYANKNRFLG